MNGTKTLLFAVVLLASAPLEQSHGDSRFHEIAAGVNGSNQKQESIIASISEFVKRSEAVAQRALDYQTAAWNKFQSHGPESKELIEANLHVAYAEIDQFTVNDGSASAIELAKAQTHLKRAEPESTAEARPELKDIEKQVTTAKMALANNGAVEKTRYTEIENELDRLIR